MNTPWVITISAPLLRPGMTLTVGPVSEKYVVQETIKALEKVREINGAAADRGT